MVTLGSAKPPCAGSIPAPASEEMKKTALAIVIAFAIFTSFGLKTSNSQEFTFEKSYQDYIFTQSRYSESFSTYQKARDAYLKNQTLTLKEEARKKTLEMLRNRDELLRVYLTALRVKIVEVGGLTQAEKEIVLAKLDSEVIYYKDHKEGYKDSDTLETLFSRSKESENRYKLDSGRKIYEALFNTSLGEVVDSRLKHQEAYTSIRGEIDTKVAEGKVRIDPFNRWFTDIEGVVGELKIQEDKAKTAILKLYADGSTNPASVFKTSIVPFEKSKDLLSTINRFLEELLTSFNSLVSVQK